MNIKIIGKMTAALITGVAVCAVGSGCSENPNKNKPHPTAVISIKDYGEVELELYQDKAPNTVANFISLANSGFYNGLIFHRIIENFMIQGGDPDGNGTGGPGYSIKGEFKLNGDTVNDIKHVPGVISMARAQPYDTAGSQFFICTSNATQLDGQYAAFGKVTKGLEIVYEISKVSTDGNDKPLNDVVIDSITIDQKGGDYSNVQKIKP